MCLILGYLLCLAFLLVPKTSNADAINLTGAETSPNIAEITVLDDRVRVALEIYIQDLAKFETLLPDTMLRNQERGRANEAERLAQFASETFKIVANDDIQLQAILRKIEPRLRKGRFSPYAGMMNPATGKQVPDAPKDKRVMYAELDYMFAGRPLSLTFVPPLDTKGVLKATIGFIAYHKAVPIIDFRYLTGPERLHLDWSDPWYRKFSNPVLKRHYNSAAMSFLYVEPREVRHEVLIRVRALENWIEFDLSDDQKITPEEQARLKEQVKSFFAKRNPLKIDDKSTRPRAARAAFVDLSLAGVKVIDKPRTLDRSTAVIGVILNYPVKNLPKHVTVDWELFDAKMKRVPATTIDPAGPLAGFVETDDSTIEWRNYLQAYQEPKITAITLDGSSSYSVPLLSVGLGLAALMALGLLLRPLLLSRLAWAGLVLLSVVGAVALHRIAVVEIRAPFSGPPETKTATKIVKAVLTNVNTAFLEKDPEILRKVFADVVVDGISQDVELELKRALSIKVPGGGIARVNQIQDLKLDDISALRNRYGFRTLARWTALAQAGHWGHAHRRTIQFRAIMELVEDDGPWKLAGLTVIEAKQSQPDR